MIDQDLDLELLVRDPREWARRTDEELRTEKGDNWVERHRALLDAQMLDIIDLACDPECDFAKELSARVDEAPLAT